MDNTEIKLIEESASLSGTMRQMEVGERVAFPLSRYGSVRSMASQLGLMLSGKWTIKADRSSRLVTVTRQS